MNYTAELARSRMKNHAGLPIVLAGRVIPAGRCEEIAKTVSKLEEVADLCELSELIRAR